MNGWMNGRFGELEGKILVYESLDVGSFWRGKRWDRVLFLCICELVESGDFCWDVLRIAKWEVRRDIFLVMGIMVKDSYRLERKDGR